MPASPWRRRTGLALSAAVATGLALGVVAVPAGARGSDDADVSHRAATSSYRASTGERVADRTAAREALGTVERLGQAPVRAGRRVDATLALLQLARLIGHLTGAERVRAGALLARPTDVGGDGTLDYNGVPEATPYCDSRICVHYVTSAPDAPDLTDANSNGVPDYVEAVLATVRSVHDRYATAGYREPRNDGSLGGGSGLIDVYLGDLGEQQLYGYCSPDADQATPPWNLYAYCAVDNDFSPAQYPRHTALQNLQVTLAHEYFHAVQFAYDAAEDPWLLEATATWAEDELYDAVDDNVQYLARGPMARPDQPVDFFQATGLFHYGTWSLFRFLTEKYPAEQGGLPKLMLDLFKRLDGAPGGPDRYSWQGLDDVLKTRHSSAAAQFAAYAAANRRSRQIYSEGKKNRYPIAPLAGQVTLTKRKPKVATAKVRLYHLSSATYRIRPKGLTKRSTKLRINLNLAPTKQGSRAIITSYNRSGRAKVITVKLNAKGDAKPKVAFSSKKVKYVEVTLINASGRFHCWEGLPVSCQGRPLDDADVMKLSAEVLR